MKNPWLALSVRAALGISVVSVATCAAMAQARPDAAGNGAPNANPLPPLAPAGGANASAPTTNPADESEDSALGSIYESQSAGIAFRPPLGCKLVETMSSKYIAEWTEPQREWTLKLGRMTLERPAPLISSKDNFGKDVEGILDKTVKNLKLSLPAAIILRQDVTNIRDGGAVDPRHPERIEPNVGLIAIRYTTEGKRKLSQQAIIQSNEGLYYLLTLTTPGNRSAELNPPEDPVERVAVETFGKMLDSVHLIDRSAIKQDQDDRLYRTRTFLVNLTPSRLHAALIPQQWIRLIKDGKDVGYSYVSEEQAAGIPRPLTKDEMKAGKNELDLVKAGDGILVGVRARMITAGLRTDHTKGPIQVDSASWFFSTIDKKHEDFSRIVVSDDHRQAKKGYVQEFAVSERRVKRFFEKPQADPNGGVIQQEDRQPIPVMKDDYELEVNQTSSVGAAEPLVRKLPPWYLPQAISHLVPRLLPLDRPRTYLFAVYVGEAREVMMRYVDVLPEQRVNFAGEFVKAIPIHDKLGFDGSVTTHYMNLDGVYLGSENKDQKLVMLPTDGATLQKIWNDANLTRPGGVEHAAPEHPAAVGAGAPVIEHAAR